MSFIEETNEEIFEHQVNVEEAVRSFWEHMERFKNDFEQHEGKCFGNIECIIDNIFYEAQQLKNFQSMYGTMCKYRGIVNKLTSEKD